jgi:ABC-type lipoprotein export system ATPase subunit
VAIARAIVGMPRLIVCDEPTASLDAKRGQDILEIIHEASRSLDERSQPRCVIVVTHDSRIFHYADRIIEMDDGLLKANVSQHIMDEAKVVPHYDSIDPAPGNAGVTSAASPSTTRPRPQ